MTLYDDLKALERLPEWIDRDEAWRKMFEHWRVQSLVIANVIDCPNAFSFESYVRPLVDENLKLTGQNYRKGVCNSDAFDNMARLIQEQMKGVLHVPWQIIKRQNNTGWWFGVNLTLTPVVVVLGGMAWLNTATVNQWKFAIITSIFFLMFGFLILSSASYEFVEDRKRRAKELLEKAKFLDRFVSEWRVSGKK